jgi:predicted esterase YcpF (UPF0227 family)
MKNILFIHGFRSTGKGSSKYKMIADVFPGAKVWAPNLTHDLSVDIPKLVDTVEKKNIDLIIGCSMGGLLADWIHRCTCVNALLINPLVDVKHLADKTGKYWTNYKNKKTFWFGDHNKDILETINSNLAWVLDNCSSLTVAVGLDDDVLDPNDAIQKYGACNLITRKDDHRFNKYFKEVLNLLK